MVADGAVRRALLGREVAVAFVLLTALYLVRILRFQALQIPAYLLIVTYDAVEVALPVLVPYYTVGFPLFLYLLAVIGAAVARRYRPRDGAARPVVRATGAVALLVGALALLFGVAVGGPLVVPSDNPTPLATLVATAGVCGIAAWLLLGRPVPVTRSRDRPVE